MKRTNGVGEVSFAQLVDLALKGEKTARTALKETGRYLGVGIGNLIQGLAPEAVIVGGPIVRAWPVIAADIRSLGRFQHLSRLPFDSNNGVNSGKPAYFNGRA